MHFSFVRYPYLFVSCISLLLQETVTLSRLGNIQRIKKKFLKQNSVPNVYFMLCVNFCQQFVYV